MTKAVFFDVANTLLYKPGLFVKIQSALSSENIHIDLPELEQKHKIVSELVSFPDKTSENFYHFFNRELLLALGIVPTEKLLLTIFLSCKNLSWEPFEDTSILDELKLPIGIISNWDNTLPLKLASYFKVSFQWTIVSQLEHDRKPNLSFYETVIRKTNLLPHEILYVGDSVKLDIEPALCLGINAILLDRLSVYPFTPLSRIKSLRELESYL